MKNSVRTHAARLSAWQARQARGRRGRTKAFLAKKSAKLRHERAALYHAVMVDRHAPIRDEKGRVIRERTATRAPHSKDRRRRRNKIATASRRANR